MLYSKENIKEIDHRAFATKNEEQIIRDVGKALSQWFIENIKKSSKILILMGPGNNGRDGEALYHQLKKHKYKVDIVKPLVDTEVSLETYEIIVDAVFGISINKELPLSCQKMFTELKVSKKFRIAIDIPSGVDPNDGRLWGEAFPANLTLTIGGYKPGLFLLPALGYCGKLEVIEVPSLKKAFQQQLPSAQFIGFKRKWIKKIRPNFQDNKYTRGKVSVLLSEEMPGAGLLAAKAALAVGAGYIHIVCPHSFISMARLAYPGFVFTPYHDLVEAGEILWKDDKTKAFCLGPGWREIPSELLPIFEKVQSSMVIDGGFLQTKILPLIQKRRDLVVTPHTGELQRISKGISKWEKMLCLTQNFDGVVLGKGFDTLIMQRDHRPLISRRNSAFLAKAGTGDILSGLISGLLAQGLTAMDSACFAVFIHTLIAKHLRYELQPETMISHIGAILNRIDSLSGDVL